MTILIPLKKKHLARGGGGQKGTYRARTGPQCCNSNCPSRPKGINRRKETWGTKKW